MVVRDIGVCLARSGQPTEQKSGRRFRGSDAAAEELHIGVNVLWNNIDAGGESDRGQHGCTRVRYAKRPQLRA